MSVSALSGQGRGFLYDVVPVLKEKIECIIKFLVGNRRGKHVLTGLEIADQFRPYETSPEATFRNLNAAFLILLCGKTHRLFSKTGEFLQKLERQRDWKSAAGFYGRGISLINSEITERYSQDRFFRKNFDALYGRCVGGRGGLPSEEVGDTVWRVFFPEGVSLFGRRKQETESLRKKRRVGIARLNPAPILDPAKEVLFTSNVLLTTPPGDASKRSVDFPLPRGLRERLEEVVKEPQIYWYDHPIQVGTARENNEAVYGLRALNEAMEFEKKRGVIAKDAKAACVLSLSVTHKGLQSIARQCLIHMLEGEDFRHLRVYAFSEADVRRLVDNILVPAAENYSGYKKANLLQEVIGVDGEYGRHYSFLKSISAFWSIFIDRSVRAAFKIDLDQVFPQKKLVEESGLSTMEHLKTPLWGAEGIDGDGSRVDLGMIAGALVNHGDIADSLFTPDVRFPGEDIKNDEWIFFSSLPQAVSTEAEMMARYRAHSSLDGRTQCLQRAHVTGGTCGILVEALRRHRPFTPSFIGRAEDQAYLLSVLFREKGPSLRYVHKDGLIMRHDKDVFASEAVKSASTGKLIGDYLRVLLFSYYARALPWPVETIKRWADPFTGCFISKIPFTVSYLRLSLRAASLFQKGDHGTGSDLIAWGSIRLGKMIEDLLTGPNPLEKRYQMEREVWNVFFDILDKVEEGVEKGDPFALGLREKARELIRDCRLNLKSGARSQKPEFKS